MPRYYPTKRDERCPCGVTGPEPAGRIRPKVPATATRGQHHPTLGSAPGQPDTALAHRPGHKHRVWPGAGMGEALPSSGALRLHMESCGHLPRGGCVLLQPGPAARPPGMRGCTGMNRECTGMHRDAHGMHRECTGGAQGMETLHGAQQEVRANHALLSCGWSSTQTLKYKLRKCRSPFTQNSAKYTSHISMSSMISRDSDQYLIQFRHVNYFVCPGACIAMQRFGFWEISGCKSHIHSMENSSPTIQQPPKYNFFPCKAKNTVDHCYEIVFHFLNFTAATW